MNDATDFATACASLPVTATATVTRRGHEYKATRFEAGFVAYQIDGGPFLDGWSFEARTDMSLRSELSGMVND